MSFNDQFTLAAQNTFELDIVKVKFPSRGKLNQCVFVLKLRKIADLTCIDKKIPINTSRHTWATHALRKGMRMN